MSSRPEFQFWEPSDDQLFVERGSSDQLVQLGAKQLRLDGITQRVERALGGILNIDLKGTFSKLKNNAGSTGGSSYESGVIPTFLPE